MMTQDELNLLKKALYPALNYIFQYIHTELGAAMFSCDDNGLMVYITDKNTLIKDVQRFLESPHLKTFKINDTPKNAA